MFTSFLMNSKEVEEIKQSVNEIAKEINVILEKYPSYPRIIILGLTGSGKSSLTCCLAKKKVKIEEDGEKFTQLTAEGVFGGCKAGTEKPMIFVDEKNKLLYVDLPGFEDVDGMINEIRNAFADDIILTSNENDIKVKILLAVSAPEFETGRGRIIRETVNRMQKMFPNPEELMKGIAIVLTKSDPQTPGSEYFKRLNKKTETKPDLKSWCDFFSRNEGRVYTFPLAQKERIGDQYFFADYDKLMIFLTDGNYLINPEHRIALSNDIKKDLSLIRQNHLSVIQHILKELFLKMNENYCQSNDSETTGLWLKTMHQLLNEKISRICEFREIIEKSVPNCEQYNDLFVQLEELEAIDSFIDRFYEFETISSCLQDSFRQMTNSALIQLKQYHLKAQKLEQMEVMNNENKKIIEKYEKGISEQQQKINQLINERDENQKELLDKVNEMNTLMTNQKNEYEEKINKMKEEFFNQRNVESAYSKENQEVIQKMMEILEKQENMIHYLASRPPVVVEDGGCLLI